MAGVLPIRTLRYCSDALARYPRARLLVTIRNEVIADLCRELWHSAIGAQRC